MSQILSNICRATSLTVCLGRFHVIWCTTVDLMKTSIGQKAKIVIFINRYKKRTLQQAGQRILNRMLATNKCKSDC